MATILDLAELSDAVYGGDASTTSYLQNNGWTALPVKPDSNSDGYYGIAYVKKNPDGSYVTNPDGSIDVVIANRGTRPTHLLTDVLNDVELATFQEASAQADAAAFARSVAAYVNNPNNNIPNPTIIETGHSLGGSDAQAGVIALTNDGTPVSGVSFNAPGVSGYLKNNNPSNITPGSYNVLNLYDQGDAIHWAGGTQLGTSIMLPAGPNTSSLALATPLAVAAGPVGIVALLVDALYKVLGPAHSINTIIGYLQSNIKVPFVPESN